MKSCKFRKSSCCPENLQNGSSCVCPQVCLVSNSSMQHMATGHLFRNQQSRVIVLFENEPDKRETASDRPSIQSKVRPKAAPPLLWWRPKAATFVCALNGASILALSTIYDLRLSKTGRTVVGRTFDWMNGRSRTPFPVYPVLF